MTYINDGKACAKEAEKKIVSKVTKLKKNNITPKLASILVGDNKQNIKYLDLKAKSAKRLGIEMKIINFDKDSPKKEIQLAIKRLNKDNKIHGIMVQLPFPESFTTTDKEIIINAISSSKDVDGMRDDSEFITPVVLAVDALVSESENYIQHTNYPIRIVIVGSKGFVGRKILKYYLVDNKQSAYLPIGVDLETADLTKRTKDADILISATGKPNLIKPHMVKKGVVLIDVGAPKGDIDKSSYDKASFVSPVPGGVGPLTIYYLMDNVVGSAENN